MQFVDDGVLVFYAPVNIFSVISKRWMCDHKRLCAMEYCLQVERIPPPAGIELVTARSVSERLTYWETGHGSPVCWKLI